MLAFRQLAQSVEDVPSMTSPGATTSSHKPKASDLTDYDPKAAANKLREERQHEVLFLRAETSRLQEELQTRRRQYEKAASDLHQLSFEDNVGELREEAAKEVEFAQQDLESKKKGYETTCMYYFTLEHMFKRLRDGKQHHIATMNTLEDALRVQKHELKLQTRLLSQVTKAYTEEKKELTETEMNVQKELKAITERLDTRRQEVQARRRLMQEKILAAKKAASMSARAAGDLSAAEEQQLKQRTADLKREAATIAYQRQTMLQKVDDIFALYNRVRVAAGVPLQPTESDDPSDLPAAQPKLISQSFLKQQAEISRVEQQLSSLNERSNYLQDAEDELSEQLQPEARNIWDEQGFDRAEVEKSTREGMKAKRMLEAVQDEYARLQKLKAQFGQSLEGLHTKCTATKTPYLGDLDTSAMPGGASLWVIDSTQKLLEVEQKLQYLKRVVESALHGDPESEGDDGEQCFSKTLNLSERDMEHRVEALISSNPQLVRIDKPTSGNQDATAAAVPSAVIHNTAHQFTNTHNNTMKAAASSDRDELDSAAGLPPGSSEKRTRRGSFGGESVASLESGGRGRPFTRGSTGRFRMDPFSKESSNSRRKATAMEIRAAVAQAYAAAGEHTDSGDAKNKGKGLKASNLTKYIAAAMSMSGAEVDEYMLQLKDDDAAEYKPRDKLKEEAIKIATDKVRQRRLGEKMRLEAAAKKLQPSAELMS